MATPILAVAKPKVEPKLNCFDVFATNTINLTYLGGNYNYAITLSADGGILTGTLTDAYYTGTLVGPITGTIDKSHVTFSFDYGAPYWGVRTFTGDIDSDGIVSGTWNETGTEQGTGTWTTATPLLAFKPCGDVVHYGPYASWSPDSGTCGNDWAMDIFDRYFKVNTIPNSDGTYTITEYFKNGTFTTSAGSSPGACLGHPDNGNTVSNDISGKMHGTFTITVTGGKYNPLADCTTGCDTTSGFIQKVFGTSNYDVPSFIFHYNAGNLGEWKNASADYGGNSGDIYDGSI